PGVSYDFLDYRTVKTYLPFHSVNTAAISMLLGYNMGLGKKELTDMGVGALLSDYSMRRYDFTEYQKKLGSPEKEEMQEHAYLSFDNIRKIYGFSSRSALVAYQHHERHNGSGYPKKLADKRIAGLSRIVAAADVYDALISKRPFRPAYRPDEAWEYIADNKGILFDPDVVSVFKKSIAKYIPGDRVLLSDGAQARIMKNKPGNMEAPVIKIIEKKERSDIITAADKKGRPSIIKITESIR
ncbi:MAG TPA: HD domain-containing phosphohydrolase, partial [Spirochaetota bacterium]|nr:HD domain-containing phosphohydrolase [Spirochaetota bacterium]